MTNPKKRLGNLCQFFLLNPFIWFNILLMDRQQLTITLKKDVLKRIDQTIDGAKIRNRSHAIEYILGEHFNPRLSKAVILAGGSGEDMRPYTLEVPKAMIPVGGRPILEYTIVWLRESGIKEVAVVIGELGQKIKDYFGDGSRFGLRITYLEEGSPKGTGGALKMTKDFVDKDTFLFIYGDVLIDLNIADLLAFHEDNNSLATLALTSTDDPSSYGAVRLSGSNIVEFREKPVSNHSTSRLVASGAHMMEPGIFDLLPRKRMFSLEQEVFPKLAEDGKLRGYVFSGKWFDIGTCDIYERALKSWKNR